MSGMMTGRGMFYGSTGGGFAHRLIFSQSGQIRGTESWDATCHQAATWGMQWVHPKVADGGNWWYSLSEIQMLVGIAHHYGLKIAPYHYCYGNKFGALIVEADISGTIANVCDGVCPDIEVEWNGMADWAMKFGKEARAKSPHGLFVPTLYADPYTVWGGQLHNATPYPQLSSWIDAWMPMAYFSVWTTGGHQDTAQNAIDFLFPQWVELNIYITHQGFTPRPILPLIELGSALPASEVYNWIAKMDHYGYCGFWYDGQMTPAYASAILSAPVPAFPAPQPPPTPQPPPIVVHEQPYSPVAPKGPGLAVEQGDPSMNQNLTGSQLAGIWHMAETEMAMNLDHPIPKTWAYLMQKRPDYALFFGPPISKQEMPHSISGLQYVYVDFAGGGRLVYFPESGTVALCAAPQAPGAVQAALTDMPTRIEVPITSTPTPAPQEVPVVPA